MNSPILIERFLTRRNLAVLCCAVAVLRVVALTVLHPAIRPFEDWAIAAHLAAGSGYTLNPALGPTAMKAPLYPLFLAIVQFIFRDHALFATVVLQHLILSFVPLLIQKVSRWFCSEVTAVLAALLFLAHPSYLYYPTVIESTNLTIPLFLLWAIAAANVLRAPPGRGRGAARCIALGLTSAALFLCQPVTAAVIGVVYLFVAKRSARSVAIALATLLVALTPWTVRNARTFHAFIPAKSPFWMNFYLGYSEDSHGIASLNTMTPRTTAEVDSLAQVENDVMMERRYRDVVMQTIASHPLEYLEKVVVQAGVYWWIPPRYWARWNSAEVLVLRVIPGLALNLLFVCGLVAGWRSHRRLSMLSAALLAYFTLVYALTATSNIRYKLDIEWVECLAAAVALEAAWRRSGATQRTLVRANGIVIDGHSP